MKGMLSTGSLTPEQRSFKVGQIYEVCLLLVIAHATWVAGPASFGFAFKHQALSVFGSVFGAEPLLRMLQYLPVLKIALLAMLILWITRRARRLTFVLAPVTFILLMSGVIETQFFAKHQTHFAAVAFVVLGAVRFYAAAPRESKTALSNSSSPSAVDPFASSALPQWAFLLMIFYIGISYSMSALTKLYFSGLQWCDGKSLMVWVDTCSLNPDGFLTQLICGNIYIAATFQTTTFVVELCALLMLFFPKMRPICGIALVGFHVSVEHLMGFGFYANIFLDAYLLIICFAIPEYRISFGDAFFSKATPQPPLPASVASGA